MAHQMPTGRLHKSAVQHRSSFNYARHVDRLGPARSPSAGLPLSTRAFNCAAYKSSELDSMSQPDPGETYCSYRVSLRLQAKREVEYRVGYAKDPEDFREMLTFSRRLQQQCTLEIKKRSTHFPEDFAVLYLTARSCGTVSKRAAG
jgi:hypothetical protein